MTHTDRMSTGPTAAPGVGRSLLGLLRAVGTWFLRCLRRLREWNRRDGAGESGLAQLIEVHVLQTAGDATVAVALAGSLFFSVPTHEARSRVALYLLITMAPFAVVAPVLGPLLDRFRHGRRIALAATMVIRAVLAVVIGHSLGGGVAAIALYPAALGVLVAGKAYTVARSAAVPRLVPTGLSLVTANARLTVAGVVAPGVAGAFAVAVRSALGVNDELWLGAVVYVIGAIFATRLPPRADGGVAEPAMPFTTGPLPRFRSGPIDRLGFPPEVRRALTSAMTLRWLSGFLLLYGAFVVREHSIGGLSSNVALGALAVGIGGGNLVGTTAGARISRLLNPSAGVILIGLTAGVCILTALDFDLLTAVGLAVVGAAAAAMTKLALDSTIQQRVADDVRTSTFGRSETAMQLSWVVGGVAGILLPTDPTVGFSVATAVVVLGLVLAVVAQRSVVSPRAQPQPHA
jgi:MFS family permease